jgi:TolB-like protein
MVGSRVRMRRMMLGMSQEKLGDALGLTFQQVRYDRTLEDIFTVQDDVTQSIVAAVE